MFSQKLSKDAIKASCDLRRGETSKATVRLDAFWKIAAWPYSYASSLKGIDKHLHSGLTQFHSQHGVSIRLSWVGGKTSPNMLDICGRTFVNIIDVMARGRCLATSQIIGRIRMHKRSQRNVAAILSKIFVSS